LGHLRRCARIAAALQGPCACLVVTGHRAAAWIVPPECEFLYIPSWDSFFATRSARWHRAPWLTLSLYEAVALRRGLLRDLLRAFAFDAILVDYLPFGLHRELEDLIAAFDGMKYFVLRGLIDAEDRAQFDAQFFPIVARHFDRIFVTTDRRIVDVATEYGLRNDVAAKLTYTGYVVPHCRETELRAGPPTVGEARVVCSGGSGFGAEPLLADCIEIAATFEDVRFDVVLGPRTTAAESVGSNGRCAVWRERDDLPALHAAADVVVTTGGYNSMVEAMQGGARLVVYAVPGPSDERWQHARRCSAWYPIHVVEDRAALMPSIRHALANVATSSLRPSCPLDARGAENIRDIVFNDLGVVG
jgi:predicted glycosyltransferase